MKLIIVPARVALGCLMTLGVACGDDDGTTTPDAGTATPDTGVTDPDMGVKEDMGTGPITAPTTFNFQSRFTAGESSVAYSGQVKRHLLIENIKKYLGGLTDQTFMNPQTGDVVSALRFFYEFTTAGGDPGDEIGFAPPGMLPATQTLWMDLGSLSDLKEKFPEFDANFTGNVVGYGDGSLTPEGALLDMFAKVEGLVLDRFNGNVPLDPSGAAITSVYVAADGVDYQQLIQKYLLGAVPYSQGTDDYLDDDTMGKGLLSANDAASDGRPYTPLEHVWDEGFGYFGAARNFADYTDDEIAQKGGRPEWQGAHDTDASGSIDLLSEHVFGHAQNAAKRDRGSSADAMTDFTADGFQAFIDGRTLIVNAGGNLDATQLAELQGFRDAAVGAWEKAIAATVVHYINDTLQDMGKFGTMEYGFLDHAKHWSEMKGFALSLQFNPNHALISAADLQSILTAMGDAPVLPNADNAAIEAYRTALNGAKATMQTAYGFDARNMGDAMGLGGW